MKQYIGTKLLLAKAMTRAQYNAHRGWTMPANENGADEGYLVEYQDGYISWSPKPQFEEAYRTTDGLPFGLAIEALKKGYRVSRTGWNGKDMWLALSGPLEGRRIPSENFWSPANRAYALNQEIQQGSRVNVLPCITMKTADGSILMGWLASQTDMLAEDWRILP
jgi:Protein of unknown function (DUF2829)